MGKLDPDRRRQPIDDRAARDRAQEIFDRVDARIAARREARERRRRMLRRVLTLGLGR
jgi:hypothetical protein